MAETGGDHGSIKEGDKASIGIEGKEPRRNPSLVSLALARTASHPAGVSSMDSMELACGLKKGVILDLDEYKLASLIQIRCSSLFS